MPRPRRVERQQREDVKEDPPSQRIENIYEKAERRKERQPNKKLQNIRGEMSDALSKLE